MDDDFEGIEVEVRVDREALRRHRRGAILGLVAFVSYLPTAFLIVALIRAMLGNEAAEESGGVVFFGGLLAMMAVTTRGHWGASSYRCPRCRRRLPGAMPRDQSESNILYCCENCRVIWDLGWARNRDGGGGG